MTNRGHFDNAFKLASPLEGQQIKIQQRQKLSDNIGGKLKMREAADKHVWDTDKKLNWHKIKQPAVN